MLSKFADLCGELGPLNAIFWGVNRFLERVQAPGRIVRYYFVAQPVAKEPLLPARRGQSIDVRKVLPGDPALRDLPLTEAVLKYRFNQNAVCFVAFQGNAVVGCLWLCLGSYDEDEVRCTFVLHPADRTAWDFDVYVLPGARGGFAFLRMWDAANAYLRELGVDWSLSRISAFNSQSLGSHGNLGARRIASALFVRVGNLQLLVSRLRPYLHLSTSGNSVPALRLAAPPR